MYNPDNERFFEDDVKPVKRIQKSSKVNIAQKHKEALNRITKYNRSELLKAFKRLNKPLPKVRTTHELRKNLFQYATDIATQALKKHKEETEKRELPEISDEDAEIIERHMQGENDEKYPYKK